MGPFRKTNAPVQKKHPVCAGHMSWIAPVARPCVLMLIEIVSPFRGTEVAKRLTLWEERRFEDLPRRAEEHLPSHGRCWHPSQGQHGACFFPCSPLRSARSTSSQGRLGPPLRWRALRAALAEPGPLTVARSTSRTCSTFIVSALFCRISAGSLPPAAWWPTRTRLCWQRKKNGKP